MIKGIEIGNEEDNEDIKQVNLNETLGELLNNLYN